MMRIALVACCDKKATQAAPAQDLYVSDLFKKSRAYAERYCDSWLILSALHHVVEPTQVIAPYDLRLPHREAFLAKWGARTTERLLEILTEPAELVILAGEPYIWSSESALRKAGHAVSKPLQGMQIGQRLAWLKAQVS